MANTNHNPGNPTGLTQNNTTPNGASSTVAVTSRHQAKISGSADRFSSRFHDAWATADSNTKPKERAVMGRSIAPGSKGTGQPPNRAVSESHAW